jgi:hypothetical protein
MTVLFANGELFSFCILHIIWAVFCMVSCYHLKIFTVVFCLNKSNILTSIIFQLTIIFHVNLQSYILCTINLQFIRRGHKLISASYILFLLVLYQWELHLIHRQSESSIISLMLPHKMLSCSHEEELRFSTRAL